MSLVLDCSVTVAWCFADEMTSAAALVLERVADEGAVVPSIWRYEVANALLVAERRKRLRSGRRELFLSSLRDLPIRFDGEGDARIWSLTLRLAERHALTVYDASYLDLAQRLRLPLATHDEDLRRAAKADSVDLVG